MTIEKMIQSTISTKALTSQPEIRTCKVKAYSARGSFGALPYRYKMGMEKPLQAPSGTPVVLKMADATGKVVSIRGVVTNPIDPSEIYDCQRGKAVVIGTTDPISGNCVALEWDAAAGQQAVGEKLQAMLMPDGIANTKLFAETFNLPNRVSIGVEPQHQLGAETSTISPSSLPKSQANDFAKEPPTEHEELASLHSETSGKDVVFVLAAPDTISFPKVAAHLTQKFRAVGKSVLAVGRTSADLETAQREWATGLTIIDGASDPAGSLTNEIGLTWHGSDDRLRDYRKRITEVDVQIAALVSQAQIAPDGSESSDHLKQLLAKRESLITELQAATREEIQSTPLVVANLDSARLCPALLERTFDVVIVDANQMTVPELMVLVGLAKTAVRIIGDCRDFSPSPYEPGNALHEFRGQNVFEFCGVTRNLDRGTSDPRMAALRYQRNTHPEVTRVVSHVVYGGLLVGTNNSRTEDQPGLEAGGVVVWNTSAFAPVGYEFGHQQVRFNPTTLALGISAGALRLPNCGSANGYQRCAVITPYVNQKRLYEAMVRDQGLNIEILTPGYPPTTPVGLVIIDLTPSSGETTPDWKLFGGVGSYAFQLVRTAMTSTRYKAVVLGDKARLMDTLPADATLRLFLQEIEHTSGPATPFPENILTAPEFLESPGCSVYVNEAAAFETMHRDIARAQSRVTWHWPRDTTKLLDKFPDGRLLIRGGGIKQSVVADLDIATVRSLARFGVRVTSPRRSEVRSIFADEAGLIDVTYRSPMEGRSSWEEDPRHCDDPCVLIDDNLLWLVGTAREEGRGRPYLRFKGSETFQLLTGFLGLDDQHSARVLDPSFA